MEKCSLKSLDCKLWIIYLWADGKNGIFNSFQFKSHLNNVSHSRLLESCQNLQWGRPLQTWPRPCTALPEATPSLDWPDFRVLPLLLLAWQVIKLRSQPWLPQPGHPGMVTSLLLLPAAGDLFYIKFILKTIKKFRSFCSTKLSLILEHFTVQ